MSKRKASGDPQLRKSLRVANMASPEPARRSRQLSVQTGLSGLLTLSESFDSRAYKIKGARDRINRYVPRQQGNKLAFVSTRF